MTRWGLWLEPTQPVSRLCELAKLAETLGAEACFVADEGTERDVYVALTAILNETDRLVVAPAITNPFSRHPVTTAAAIATLAEIAPDRVWHGLGVGGTRVFEPLGLKPARPYTALCEMLDVNQRLFRGEQVSEASLRWSEADIPIVIAGRGPRVQALGASRADWVILSGKALSEIPDAAARIRSAGHAGIIWSAYLAYNDIERGRALRHFSYIALDAPPEIQTAAGLDKLTANRVKSAMLSGDLDQAAALLPQTLVDHYAVSGSPAECAEVIGGLSDHFDLYMLPLNDEIDAEAHIIASAEILRGDSNFE